MRRSNEPLWWVPFGGGMMIDALTMPALVIITGFLVAAGMISPAALQAVLSHPLTRAALFVIISMTFFHAAHRTRVALPELGVRAPKLVLRVVLYGGAILGTIAAGLVALRMI